MEKELDSDDKIWLVKSSMRILGPFTFSGLVDLLRMKQITIIDEVRQPQGRWAYIRENQELMEAIKKGKGPRNAFSEETLTESVTHKPEKWEDNAGDSDLTPIPEFGKGALKDVTPSGSDGLTETRQKPGKVYSYSGDAGFSARVQKKASLFWWLAVALMVLVFAGLFISLSQKDKRRLLQYQELMDSAIRYKNLGVYEKAFDLYLKGIQIKEADLQFKNQLAPLIIAEGHQTSEGRRVLEDALKNENQSRDQKIEAYLGIALSFMLEGDLSQAERTLEKAAAYEPLNHSLQLNLAIIQNRKGNYTEAFRLFSKIVERSPHMGLALLGKAQSAIESARAQADHSPLQDIVGELRAYVARNGYLRKEMFLMLAVTNSMLGKAAEARDAIEQILNQPFGQAKNFIHPFLVDHRFSHWENLVNYCSSPDLKVGTMSFNKLFLSACLIEVNKDSEAGVLQQEAIAEKPRDPLNLIVNASRLIKQERLLEAKLILKSSELEANHVRYLMLGGVCLQTEDFQCAKENFSELKKRGLLSPELQYGLAVLALKDNEFARALEHVRSGLEIEPKYIPLVELRDRLEYEK